MGNQNKPLFPNVTVDGQAIASADIAAEAQNHTAPKGKPGLAWRAAARALVVRRLLLNAANQAGLQPEPELLGVDLQETQDEATIRAYMEKFLTPENISGDKCRAVFKAHPERYCAPDLYQVSHILLAANPVDRKGRRAAKLAAKGLLETIKSTPQKFNTLAKIHSDCASAQNNGQLGQLGQGDTVPEFERALDSLGSGEICSEIVETSFGFHIIRMDEMARGKNLPYAAVKEIIREALEKTAWAIGARDLVKTLVKNAVIVGIDILPVQKQS